MLGIRPESFEDAAFADASLPQLDVEVAVVEDLGSDAHVIFPVDAPRIEAEELRQTDDDEALIVGDGVGLHCPGRRRAPLPGSASRSASSIDPAGFYWFDPDTGASLHRRAASAADKLVLR